MIFSEERFDQVIKGAKTQTRRPRLKDDVQSGDPVTMVIRGGRQLWRVGSDYAVQRGRGQLGVWWNPKTGETNEQWLEECRANGMDVKTWGEAASGVAGFVPLRIKIESISLEFLGDINEVSAHLEGMKDRDQFMRVWHSLYKNTNPLTLVWVLTFEVSRPE